jgi:hypothetical protein
MKKILSGALVVLLLVSFGPLAVAQGPDEAAAPSFAFTTQTEPGGGKTLLQAFGQFFSNAFFVITRAYIIHAYQRFGILSRINANKHLEYNQKFDSRLLQDGPIQDQNDMPVRNLKYGTRNFWYNGCELAAVYNALLEFGKAKPLSEIIYDFERTGAVWLEGEFGTKIAQYKKYLAGQGLKLQEFRSAAALDQARKDGDIFVITYQNQGHLSVHTIMVKQAGQTLTPYNVRGGSFESFAQLLHRHGRYLLGFLISA